MAAPFSCASTHPRTYPVHTTLADDAYHRVPTC